MPPEFAVQYATETRVKKNQTYAERQAQEIRDHAARAGRDLTPEEEEKIDILLAAGDAAETSIRTGNASDLEL
jgi:hypothetical protein